ncbi:MAG TPA: thioredoxin domain-containing protein [Kaistiaceae bacterium]|nr:thioredoxin domain-containing protein [Kaistiaceae bacterium]
MRALTGARRIFDVPAVLAAAFLVLAGAGLAVAADDEEKTFPAEDVLAAGPEDDKSLGSPDAKVTIVEYASLTCSHCADFHGKTFPELKKRYIDTGKVRFIFREYPLDALAMAASALARCSAPDRFFDVTGMFFDTQTVWAFTDKPVEGLTALARQIGFTQESFDACLTNRTVIDGLDKVKRTAFEKFGLHSTPTFYINGQEFRGARTIEEFATVIDPLL